MYDLYFKKIRILLYFGEVLILCSNPKILVPELVAARKLLIYMHALVLALDRLQNSKKKFRFKSTQLAEYVEPTYSVVNTLV